MTVKNVTEKKTSSTGQKDKTTRSLPTHHRPWSAILRGCSLEVILGTVYRKLSAWATGENRGGWLRLRGMGLKTRVGLKASEALSRDGKVRSSPVGFVIYRGSARS